MSENNAYKCLETETTPSALFDFKVLHSYNWVFIDWNGGL